MSVGCDAHRHGPTVEHPGAAVRRRRRGPGRGAARWPRAGRSSPGTSASAARSSTSSRSTRGRRGRWWSSRSAAVAVATTGWPRRRSTTASARRCGGRSGPCSRRAPSPTARPLPALPLRVDLVAIDRGPTAGRPASAITGASAPDPPIGPERGPVLHSRPPRDRPRHAPSTPAPANRGRPGAHTRISTPQGRCPPTGRRRAGTRPPTGIRGGTTAGGHPVPTVSMRQLLEAGVHFGHQTRRWNPKMKPYIFAERNGIHIIDLAQTVKRLDTALEYVTETVARGESVLFVGTKKQAQEPVDAGGDPRRPAVRHQALARRHADQLRHHQEAHRPARPARGPAARRRLRPPPQEGGRAAHRGAQQAPGDARRHPQDEARSRARSSSSTRTASGSP